MKKILQFKLKILAKLVLKKYKPKVIGVTGSVGKTTTKEAIFTVLSKKYRVGKSLKNYNNELGLPLSILGFESPGKNFWGWSLLFWEVFKLLCKRSAYYPEILVLEMGIDRPGDMDYLNKIVRCDIGVVTNIGMSHIEFFGTVDRIKREKSKLITGLKKKGLAVINYDNEKSREIINLSKEKVLSYGLDEKAQVRAEEIKFKHDCRENGFVGTNFKIRNKGAVVPVFIEGSIGYHLIYSALAAAAIATEFDYNLLEIAEALNDFETPKGRLKIHSGKNGSIIIDDTYNSSPQSCFKALELVSELENKPGKKIAVFGDMLELGDFSEEEHMRVGSFAAKKGVDCLYCVGSLAEKIAVGAGQAKMKKENIFVFKTKKEALKAIINNIKEKDIVLVKGSQGSRMELLVAKLIEREKDCQDLLVRQEKEWKRNT